MMKSMTRTTLMGKGVTTMTMDVLWMGGRMMMMLA